ncbi:DsbA family oxidoreductase [Maritimibacter dapengensis]|uniref:DsbA family oxidoreductase n=1 Tax=Maritimibacter dapengensis TaxID=2836868 RepID=A0ABS6T315_9RHOB|nr:DsbA family oxidoreductase [Maritimibacter dapengensis]MBV7379641.1 DsbA family oxidoreductase [Maritimibacter dapengensis]
MVKLYIFSDPICPWCYIGKARLDAALLERPDHPFEIEWHPFMLNPDMPADGMDRRAYLEAKFGGKDGAVQAYLPVQKEAEASGLTINLDKIERTPSTIDAHRLIHWAHLEGRQTATVSRLFQAYFVDGRDIGDRAVLGDIAEGTGMDREMVERLFETGADEANIRARDIDAREKGVNAVPTFVIANQHVVPGAQPTDLWLKVIDEIQQGLRESDDTTH